MSSGLTHTDCVRVPPASCRLWTPATQGQRVSGKQEDGKDPEPPWGRCRGVEAQQGRSPGPQEVSSAALRLTCSVKPEGALPRGDSRLN